MAKSKPKATARTPGTCPFRAAVRSEDDGTETARCRLLKKISGVRDREVLDAVRIPHGVCQLCCVQEEPTPTKPNPTVASRLLDLVKEVEARQGVDGLDPMQASQLRTWAIGYLTRLKDAESQTNTPPYTGKCIYLSERLKGDRRPRRYRCAHELHEETTTDQCRKCPDYDQRLPKGGGVERWATALVTAPRKQPTLERTLKSLAAAGWDEPYVFADAGTEIEPGLVPADRLVQRTTRYFGWGNFFGALCELLLIEPEADAYMLVEDDVLFCGGLRSYLERELWPAKRLGFLSLHAAAHQDRGDGSGFYPTMFGGGLWGSQALLFPSATARMLVRHPRVINHRSRGPRSGTCDQDVVFGAWAAGVGLPVYFHTPSLTQHIGETSAIWGEEATLEGNRLATTFPGEDKDISDVMAESKPAARRAKKQPGGGACC